MFSIFTWDDTGETEVGSQEETTLTVLKCMHRSSGGPITLFP
jgi:hypothetical protein